MKRFETKELREAAAHAAAGGQALHVCASRAFVGEDAPACFKRSELFAHLMDQDVARLEATARKLGVYFIKVERRGEPFQHVDLCGSPLAKALVWAEASDVKKPAQEQGMLAI